MNLMFKISYGLYLLAANDGNRDNACMINTFMQQTNAPETFSVTVNKTNLTHDMIAKSKKCVVAILSTSTKFETIKNFGMQSGKTANKFEGVAAERAQNGVLVATDGVIGYFELDVESSVDMGTHTMFILKATANKVLADGEPLTYGYYQSNIKPKPQPIATDKKERWICRICGYIYEGSLPADFICPICKHPASDFERLD
ncbi:MAG: flavin reductase [Clostridia bacterium]